MTPTTGQYDDYSTEYAASVAIREQGGVEGDPYGILPRFLELLGDVDGQSVLDAGCGEGYLARVLAARGAHVTGIDLSPRLIALARQKTPGGEIDYRVADLSTRTSENTNRFDAVTSFLVLNDVEDFQGFAAALAALLKPGGRMVHAFNNPYAAVIRKHVANYFDSGVRSPYVGLWEAGIKTYHHHRTLEEYLDAFLINGMRLTKLADLSGRAIVHEPGSILPEGYLFPRFMLVAFSKPE